MEPGCHGDSSLFLDSEVEELRWFLLPSEAARCLATPLMTTAPATPPFTPRRYSNSKGGGEASTASTVVMEISGELCNGVGPDSIPNSGMEWRPKFHLPPKNIMKPTIEVGGISHCYGNRLNPAHPIQAIEEYGMIRDGDRVLVCLSGGKDSLSLLHTLRQYSFLSAARGVSFTLGAVTVDPGSASYNPRPLIPYLTALGLPYFFEEQGLSSGK